MGTVGTDNSGSIIGNEAVTAQRKALGPAFRMAVLTGALESVRLHVRAAVDVDATDEKGRSALMLAASKGHLEICRLLLAAGANPELKDRDGNDALSAAILHGRVEVVALLRGVESESASCVTGNSEQEFCSNNSRIAPDTSIGSLDANEPHIVYPALADGPDANGDVDISRTGPDEDGTLDLSAWQEAIETPAPPDDPTCAKEAHILQSALSQHVPIDADENWDDVEIDLPELEYQTRRRVLLTSNTRLALRSLVVEALRDGRVRADRINQALPEYEGIGDVERAEIEADLNLVLGDLGTVIDDNFLAPDAVIDEDENDDERFGEVAADAVNFVGRLLSNDADPFTQYAKALPSLRLTREEETALGMAIQESGLEVLAAIASSPSALSRLQSDSEAVLNGKLPARAILDSPSGDVSREDVLRDGGAFDEEAMQEAAANEALIAELPADFVAHLTAIVSQCRQNKVNQTELAQRLFAAGLTSEYLAQLQDATSQDVCAVDANMRVRAGFARAENAKKRLVLANLRLVIWVAKRHGGLPLLDKIQEGNIGLMRAADRFDPRIGAKFSTYAVWWIRQNITRAAADAGRTIRIPVHVHENLRKIEKARLQALYESGYEPDADAIAVLAGLPLDMVRKLMRVPEDAVLMDSEPEVADCIERMADEKTPSPEAEMITSDTRALVTRQLGCLRPKEERIVRLRFGIGCDEHTLEEVGQMFDVTRERIRQIEAKALRKLGHPGRVKRLRDELQ